MANENQTIENETKSVEDEAIAACCTRSATASDGTTFSRTACFSKVNVDVCSFAQTAANFKKAYYGQTQLN